MITPCAARSNLLIIGLFLLFFLSFSLGFLNFLRAQALNAPEVEAATQKAALKAIAQKLKQSFVASKEKALAQAKIKGWHIVDEDTLEGYKAELVGVDSAGYPIYYRTRNLAAARTIRTTKVWPGGNDPKPNRRRAQTRRMGRRRGAFNPR